MHELHTPQPLMEICEVVNFPPQSRQLIYEVVNFPPQSRQLICEVQYLVIRLNPANRPISARAGSHVRPRPYSTTAVLVYAGVNTVYRHHR